MKPRASKSRADAAAALAEGAQAFVDSHRDQGNDELFGIAELCRAFGITPRALRFYEDKGLISPRRLNSTRIYTRRDRARITLILRAKAIGSTLEEIRHYLDLYGQHGEGRVQQLTYVLNRTDEAIAELEARRKHLEATLAELKLINAGCRRQLEERRRTAKPGKTR